MSDERYLDRGLTAAEPTLHAMTYRTIAVVGTSLAGLRAAETLRSEGFDGRILMVGAEERLPYDRPPLSKEVLAGTRDPSTIELNDAARYEKLAFEWQRGRTATALDAADRVLHLDDGQEVAFDGLIIATGATPRQLPNAGGVVGVHTLRTLDDCLAIRDQLDASPRVAVVGAGFIGLEVAATCRRRGLEVTVVEALPVPLAPVLGVEMGSVLEGLHRDQGVDVRCGVGVEGFEGGARVEALRLGDGSRVPADVVIVGIGVVPSTGWLDGSGLEIDNGVVCDASCSAGVEGIVAAGDVARWPNPLFGELMRVEHWTNAVEQGMAAAQRLLAGPSGAKPFAPVPYFWSDQYDTKIQFVGRARPDDHSVVVGGSLEDRQFVAIFEREGYLVAALALNRPRLLMECRRMLATRTTFVEARARLDQT